MMTLVRLYSVVGRHYWCQPSSFKKRFRCPRPLEVTLVIWGVSPGIPPPQDMPWWLFSSLLLCIKALLHLKWKDVYLLVHDQQLLQLKVEAVASWFASASWQSRLDRREGLLGLPAGTMLDQYIWCSALVFCCRLRRNQAVGKGSISYGPTALVSD